MLHTKCNGSALTPYMSSMGMRIHKYRIAFCLLVVVQVPIFLLVWSYWRDDEQMCDWDEDKSIQSYDRCLNGVLYGTSHDSGMGNVIFEILALISLAKQTNRKPTITHYATLHRASKVLQTFPTLRSYLDNQMAICRCFQTVIVAPEKCCIYNESFVKEIEHSEDETVRIKSFYTQGHKYLRHLSRNDVLNLLKMSVDVQSYAENELFALVKNRKNKKNVCVHLRRGDFVDNSVSLPSNAEFSVLALQHLLKGPYANADVYVMSDDHTWATEQLRNISNVYVASSTDSSPPNAEWDFSRRYCDRVLLTASVSTYGWWMAYLSRGQDVYYNKEFSTPGGIEDLLNPEDFWPPNWTSLHLRTKQYFEEN